MRRWIGPEKTDLFAPIVELYLQDPTAGDLVYVAGLTSLKALEIKGGSLDATSLKRLGRLRQLTTLCLRNVGLNNQSLSGLANCPRLSRIMLIGRMTPEALEPLKNCESLSELYLEGDDHLEGGTRESPFLGVHLAVIAKIPHLKHLKIQAGEIDDSELRGLAYAQEIETLTVHSLRPRTDAINDLGRLPRLQQLVLEPYGFDTYQPRPLKGFPALKAFSITNSRITSSFITSLAKLPKLEALSFNVCRVNENVAELGDLPRLKLLDLSATDVQSTPYRKIGHLNATDLCEIFVDAQTSPGPNPEDLSGIRREDYFNQPEWPGICTSASMCFFF